MVQEYVSPVRTHKYTFEMVMAAYERRFPSCPQIPVVVDCPIVEDSWSADNSCRDTTRRCQLQVDAPYLLKKMIGVDYVYFIQKNHLDLRARELEIEATNETFANRIEVLENCRFFVHPENPEWTCFEQRARLDVKNFLGLESTVEKIALKQYAANIAKGKELVDSFMREVNAEGITSLRPWDRADPEYNRQLRRVLCRNVEPTEPSLPAPAPAPAAQPHRLSQPGTSQANIRSRTRISGEGKLRRSSDKKQSRDEDMSESLAIAKKQMPSKTARSDGELSAVASSISSRETPGMSMGSKDSCRRRSRVDNVGTSVSLDSLYKINKYEYRPCHCNPARVEQEQVPAPSRYDNMLIIVLLAVLLSAPVTYLYRTRTDRR